MVFVVLLFIGLCASQSTTRTKWLKEEYPNPVVNPTVCRRPGISQPRICDPNNLMNKADLNKLDTKIKDISKTTACVCDSAVCNTDNSGYSVSIALLEQMNRDQSSEDTISAKLVDARVFTEHLGRQSWNFARCENDVVILYSRNDNLLYIATGKNTQKLLTDDIVHDIALKHQRDFPDNMYVGLDKILDKIKKTLKGERYEILPQKQLPNPPPDDSGAASNRREYFVTALTLLAIILVF